MKKIPNLFLILIVVVLTACSSTTSAEPTPAAETVPVDDVISEGRLEPVFSANLTFQARGVVESISVKAGDAVKAGDELARLANAGTAEAQLVIARNAYDTLLRNESGDRARLWEAYMKAQVVRAEAEEDWEDLNVDDIEDRIDDIKARIEDRQEDLKDAQEDFDKYKDLDEDNSNRKNAEDDLERAQEDLNQAIRDLEDEMRERDEVYAAYQAALGAEAEAKHQYEISLDGPNTDQLALAKANLDAAKAALANYVITAPFDGTVADVSVNVGEQVSPETRIISVADYTSWYVETTDVTELEVVKLSVGQPVVISPDALPDVSMPGVITEISNAYTQQGGDILYTVRIKVNEPDARLRWGMTVEALFTTLEQ